jgi:hypothetical protein
MKVERWAYIITIVLLVILLLQRGCKDKPCPPCPPVEIKGDTVYVPQPVQVIPGPVNKVAPNAKKIADNANKIASDATGSEWQLVPESQPDPGYVVPENTISIYNDTLKFKGDAGYAVVKDSVDGKILSRSFSYKLTTINPVLPIAAAEKKKGALYAGFMALGNAKDPLGYIGASGLWVPRNQKQAYSFGFGTFNSKAYLQAGILFKIK